MTTDCLICREAAGAIPLPGGHLYASAEVFAFHVPPQLPSNDVLEGYSMIAPVRHAADFGELTEDEAAEIGRVISMLTRLLRELGAERVYVASIGHSHAHLHVHLVPRWPGVDPDIAWWDVRVAAARQRVDRSGAEEFADRMIGRLSRPIPAHRAEIGRHAAE